MAPVPAGGSLKSQPEHAQLQFIHSFMDHSRERQQHGRYARKQPLTVPAPRLGSPATAVPSGPSSQFSIHPSMQLEACDGGLFCLQYYLEANHFRSLHCRDVFFSWQASACFFFFPSLFYIHGVTKQIRSLTDESWKTTCITDYCFISATRMENVDIGC